MSYDAHDHFPFRTLIDGSDDGFGGYHAPDGDYDFRAMISHTSPSPIDGSPILTVSLFPPVQLKTTDSKYDFNRHLNLHLDSLKSNGVSVTNVIVSQGGKTLYSFQA
jgi:hypothetical protein